MVASNGTIFSNCYGNNFFVNAAEGICLNVAPGHHMEIEQVNDADGNFGVQWNVQLILIPMDYPILFGHFANELQEILDSLLDG